MTASSHLPSALFHPGIAAIYAWTGASPSALAICGLPPESSLTGEDFFAAFDDALVFRTALRGLRVTRSPFDLALALALALVFAFAMPRRLAFLRRRITRHGGLDQCLEGCRIHRFTFVQVDGPAHVALESRIEETRRVRKFRAVSEDRKSVV